jgi:hypothetical protein
MPDFFQAVPLCQGLCVSRRRVQEQGEGGSRVLGVIAQAGTDLPDTCAPQEIEGGFAQQGHDGRSLPAMDQAAIFAQDHIRDIVQGMLDPPMTAFERQEPFGWPRLGGEAFHG